MRPRSLLSLVIIGLFNIGSVQASEPVASDTAACVEVEVDGVRTPSYNCLSQKMQPKANTTKNTNLAQMGSEAIVGRPSNQLGLFNRAATGHRMGNNFGTSVYPQRPPDKP